MATSLRTSPSWSRRKVAADFICADSQEAEFTALLAAAGSYRFTSRGELVLGLDDGGSAVFR